MKRMLSLLPLLLFSIFIITIAAHADPSVRTNRKNSVGVEQMYENPNTYMFGALACGHFADACGFLKDSKERIYTNLRFQPYNTAALYDEPVLFCGDVSDSFKGKRGALVVTYRRQATLNYKGVGCHELMSVFEVPAPKELQ